MLSQEEAASILGHSSTEPTDRGLAKLLFNKGLITQQEYEDAVSAMIPRDGELAAGPVVVPAVMRTPVTARDLPLLSKAAQNRRNRSSFQQLLHWRASDYPTEEGWSDPGYQAGQRRKTAALRVLQSQLGEPDCIQRRADIRQQ
jgi:hypothetical protein